MNGTGDTGQGKRDREYRTGGRAGWKVFQQVPHFMEVACFTFLIFAKTKMFISTLVTPVLYI
jgi:hypothetical protein